MLQIVIWMMCVYMILKGQELQITARASTHEDRDANIRAARGWAYFAYTCAFLFFVLSLAQGASMQGPPRF